MSTVLCLPDDILIDLFSHWMPVNDVCVWDAAFCNSVHRHSVLQCISNQNNCFIVNFDQTFSLSLFNWLVDKDVSHLSGCITIDCQPWEHFKSISDQFDVSKMNTVIFKGSLESSSNHVVVKSFLQLFPSVLSLQMYNLNQCLPSEVGSQYVSHLVSICIVDCDFGSDILIFLSKHCLLLKAVVVSELVSASMTSIISLLIKCKNLSYMDISVSDLSEQTVRAVYYDMKTIIRKYIEIIVSGDHSEHEETEITRLFSDVRGFKEIKINLPKDADFCCSVFGGDALNKLVINNVMLVALTLGNGIGGVDMARVTASFAMLNHLQVLSIQECESCTPVEFSKMIQAIPLTLTTFETNYSKLNTIMLIQVLAFRVYLNKLGFLESDLICIKSLLKFAWTYCRDIMINNVNFGDGSSYLKIRNW